MGFVETAIKTTHDEDEFEDFSDMYGNEKLEAQRNPDSKRLIFISFTGHGQVDSGCIKAIGEYSTISLED